MCGLVLGALGNGSRATLAAATSTGVAPGILNSTVFAYLRRTSPTSGRRDDQLAGAMGQVVVPIAAEGRGRVAVEVGGQRVHLSATAFPTRRRRQTAEVLKEARVAEAQRTAEAEESEALARQRAQIATAHADLQIAEQQNALRVRQAELEALAGAAEAPVAGEKARVMAEQSLEAVRVQLETQRLEADVVAPARGRPGGQAVGNAEIELFRRLLQQYQAAGAKAQRVSALRMLPELVDKIVSSVAAIDIDKASIIDSGGQGSGVPGLLRQLPSAIIGLVEQIETATGVDLFKALRPDDPLAVAAVDASSGAFGEVPADPAAPVE